MSTALSTPSSEVQQEQGKLVADLFHALNQPITSLRCVLELGLFRQKAGEQQATLESGIELVDEIGRLAGAIRTLVEAGGSGTRTTAYLGDVLLELVEDCSIMAKSEGTTVSLGQVGPCPVLFGPDLRHAVFQLLQFVLAATQENGQVRVEARESGTEVVLELNASPQKSQSHATDRAAKVQQLWQRWRLAVARNTFTNAGGSLSKEEKEEDGALTVRIMLPRAVPPQ